LLIQMLTFLSRYGAVSMAVFGGNYEALPAAVSARSTEPLVVTHSQTPVTTLTLGCCAQLSRWAAA
jgi:hypothetical protein